jgi:outer membrane protein insertion porin family
MLLCVSGRLGLGAALGAFATSSAAAQAPLFLIDADTRVASIDLSFPGTETLERDAIRLRIALTEPGLLAAIQAVFDILPFISTPAPHPFSPLELGRDAVRIERYYQENGFLETSVEYEVQLDTASNSVDVTFHIDEGRPLLLDTVGVTLIEGTSNLDTALVRDWDRFTERMGREKGIRLSEVDRIRLRSRPLEWLRTNGYAFANVLDTLLIDSAAATADLHIRVDAGPRARVDSVAIEGIESLSYNTVRREIPIRNGDWFSAGKVSEGQRQVFGLGLVRLALFDVAADQPRDSTVTLLMRVEEGRPRAISGELGYATERGAVLQGQWEHRDFMGGARSFTVSGVANTGWMAVSDNVDRRFGLSTALRQPYIFDYRLSGSVRPFVEYRDDIRDESFTVGSDASLLFERGALRQASVTYTISNRHVIDAPTLTARIDEADTLLLSAIPVDVGNVSMSRLGLSVVIGHVDDPVGPRRGYITRTSVEAAGPPAISSVQYGRVEGSVTGFLPVGRSVSLVGRVSGGRLFPYGESVPDSLGEVLPILLRLRDAVFTAGGTGDVRGWGNAQLGPKVPDLRLVKQGDSVIASADRYLVLSGLARLTASLEMRLPFPFLGPRHGTHVFFDAGRIWTADDRFYDPSLPRDPLGQEKFFFGTGLGVEFGTIVGPLRIDVGYKLNPSPLDLRDPDPVARALVAGQPILSVPTRSLKRWHLHIAIGRTY